MAASVVFSTAGLFAQNDELSYYDVWYRELTWSQLQLVADGYDRVSRGATVPKPERELAAYRAGWCYEVLDAPRLAAKSYRWLAENGLSSRLKYRAIVRLRAIDRGATAVSTDASEFSLPRNIPSVIRDQAMRDVLTAMLRELKKRSEIWTSTDRDLDATELQSAALSRLLQTLRDRGLALTFSAPLLEEPWPSDGTDSEKSRGDTEPPAASGKVKGTARQNRQASRQILDAIRRDVDGSLSPDSRRGPLWDEVGNRLYERALQRCSLGDVAGGRRLLVLADVAASRGEGRGVPRTFRRWFEQLRSEQALAKLAKRRYQEIERERRARLRRSLGEADRISGERPDRFVQRLNGVFDELALTPQPILRDPEIQRLIEVLSSRYDLASPEANAEESNSITLLRDLRVWRQDSARDQLERLERWLVQRAEIRRMERSPAESKDPNVRRLAQSLEREIELERQREERKGVSDENRERLQILSFQASFLQRWFTN